MRLGLGPVFAFESLTQSRRWQLYALRSVFAGLLLASLGVVWWGNVAGRSLPTIRAQAEVGQQFCVAIVGTQLVLVLLAAPAATAGAICLDKSRGTLAHVLVTDLSSVEIVLGKLAARLVPVLGLVACGLPTLALGSLLGGIDPRALTEAFLLTVGVALVGCALALVLSVWGSKVHEVLAGTYLILLVWVLAGPSWWLVRIATGATWGLPDWAEYVNPFWLAITRITTPGRASDWEGPIFLGASALVAVGLASMAVLRLRSVAAREGCRGGARTAFARALAHELDRFVPKLPGPRLDPNPVLWREWHRRRPKRWARFVWSLYLFAAVAITALAIATELESSTRGTSTRREVSIVLVSGQTAVGFLLLSLWSATALAEERVRGSLDILLTTPMPTRSILWGKWWGVYRATLVLSVFPGLATLPTAYLRARWEGFFLIVAYVLTVGAALTSLGLALATWVSQLGRAIALTVTAYILVTVGWIFLVVGLMPRSNGVEAPGMASASPFFGVIFLLIEMSEPPHVDWYACLGWMMLWTTVYAATALGLALATHATFDRCLGRRPEPFLPALSTRSTQARPLDREQ
jgi:ABC-type transport system involved in multi-copper enzyme maturation permease subunit